MKNPQTGMIREGFAGTEPFRSEGYDQRMVGEV